jgi:serine protease inhibitor
MEFKMANRLYVQSGFSLEAGFKSALVKFFGASAEIVDFMDRRNTVGLINEWVAEQTNGKIKKLVKQSNKFFMTIATTFLMERFVFFRRFWGGQSPCGAQRCLLQRPVAKLIQKERYLQA